MPRRTTNTTGRVTFYSRFPEAMARWTGHDKPLLWNLLAIGFPTWLIFNVAFFQRFDQMQASRTLLASFYLASCWLWIGPLLIFLWEREVDRFCCNVTAQSERDAWSLEPFDRLRRQIDRWHLLFPFGFVVPALVGEVVAMPALRDMLNNRGWNDPIQWVSLLLSFFFSFLSGVGLWGILKTVALVSVLRRTQIRWQPFHEDNFGGLQFIGRFCLRTTLFFCVGSITVPAVLQVATFLRFPSSYLVGSLPAVYSVALGISITIPLVAIAALVREQRKAYLAPICAQLSSVLNESVENRVPHRAKGVLPGVADARENLEALLILYDRIRDSRVYPLDVAGVIKASVSVAAPLIIASLEKMVP
jgi:hypothetical protein